MDVPISQPCPCCCGNWNFGTRLKAPQPDHPWSFISAKIAATFIQLRNEFCLPQSVSELTHALVEEGPRKEQKHN
jgi:hypothetical protein